MPWAACPRASGQHTDKLGETKTVEVKSEPQKEYGFVAIASGEGFKSLFSELGVDVKFESSAVDYLAREGTDPVYGARPLRRTITHLVEDSFATSMLEGKFAKGDSVCVTADENGLIWEKMK